MTTEQALAMDGVLDEVANERERQHAKWGEQSWPNGTGVGALEELSYQTWAAEEAKTQCQQAFARGVGTYAHILYEEVAEAFVPAAHAEARLLNTAAKVLGIQLEHAKLTGRIHKGSTAMPRFSISE